MEQHSESHNCVGENKYHAENIFFFPSSDPQMKGQGSKKNLSTSGFPLTILKLFRR